MQRLLISEHFRLLISKPEVGHFSQFMLQSVVQHDAVRQILNIPNSSCQIQRPKLAAFQARQEGLAFAPCSSPQTSICQLVAPSFADCFSGYMSMFSVPGSCLMQVQKLNDGGLVSYRNVWRPLDCKLCRASARCFPLSMPKVKLNDFGDLF